MAQANTLDMVRLVHIIAHQTDEIFDHLLRTEFNLTVARFRILMPLIEVGPMTQADVARFYFLTEASIARQVRLLVADGYLKRIPDQADGRKFTLTFTAKTEALLPQIKKRLGEEMARVYHTLTKAELEFLTQVLTKLKLLGAAETTTSFGVCLSDKD
jgi:DNA-binding MarR family transcriptional regulator